MQIHQAQHHSIDLNEGTLKDADVVERRLSDLKGYFDDQDEYERVLDEEDDPLLYRVHRIAPSDGDGDLHYGLGTLQPGTIGQEYFMTKGHLHEWRDAAEVYVGLEGTGRMLLEDEETGESSLLSLNRNDTVYVPGHVAHRTVNVGDAPLKYLGIYPARAGHDYGRFEEENFQKIVVWTEDGPTLKERP